MRTWRYGERNDDPYVPSVVRVGRDAEDVVVRPFVCVDGDISRFAQTRRLRAYELQ